MKISWEALSQSNFIQPWPQDLDPVKVAAQLTMAGIELEQLEQAADCILDLNITPNRGDCLSFRGLSREIAVLNDLPFTDVALLTKQEQIADSSDHKIVVENAAACPLYTGQTFLLPEVLTALPEAFTACLTASGISLVNPIVDLSNYVMLVLGQPLHAFDAAKIQDLEVRFAHEQESFIALGNRTLSLTANTLVIADQQGVQALAGIIGGAQSAVTSDTDTIFVESAHFNPLYIAGKARQYGLQTDAAFRFERGVDPALPLIALKLFSALAEQHLGLKAGLRVIAGEVKAVAVREPIFLTAHRIERLLGFEIHTGQIEKILAGLGMSVQSKAPGWQVTPPSSRFDIRIEADLIEELVRIIGYDMIPAAPLCIKHTAPEALSPLAIMAQHLVTNAYHEVISYSFISESLHEQCFVEQAAIRLQNPLSSELAVMRLSLWPSLLQTAMYNQDRQQTRAKLFESGLIYLPEFNKAVGTYEQPQVLAGLLTGTLYGEEWASPLVPIDFYDVKADVEKLLQVFAPLDHYRFAAFEHSMLHPGQSAAIYHENNRVGTLGRLHPQLQQTLEFNQPVFLFELFVDHLPTASLPQFAPFSKFPTIKRKFAFFVKRDLVISDFCAAIKNHLTQYLVDFRLFDVYQGKGVALDEKSVAFSIVLEDKHQTWTDAAIQSLSDDLVAVITQQFSARLRDGN